MAREIKKVAVIGCGFIGFGWITVFARNGIEVNAFDSFAPSMETVKDRVRDGLNFFVDENVIKEEDIPAIMDRIKLCSSLEEAVADADYVQECIPENLELKQNLFRDVANLTDETVAIGSSCSGLQMSDIAAKVTNHPERCIVSHPTNPPHIVAYMEIAGDTASNEVKQHIFDFMESIGQKPIICKEIYGYVLNRMQLAVQKEALYMIQEDICSVEAVERAITDGVGMRWPFTGPLATEELNSASIEEGMYKYKDYMMEFFTKEQKPLHDISDELIAKVCAGVKPIMNGRTHDEYRLWRDQMVTRTRLMKEKNPI